MRKLQIALAVAAAFTMVGGTGALALDKCKPAVSGKGKAEDTMDEAMESAKKAWRRAVDKKYDEDYAKWYYSGDRSLTCKWNKDGDEFTCSASARPCKPQT